MELQLHPDNSYRLQTAEAIREYILGGRGIVTLQSPSGKYRTYRFQYPTEIFEFPEGSMF